MIRENNTMTFTKRLNYSVSELTQEEFLLELSKYSQSDDHKKHAETIKTKLKTAK
jgi:hypothetical protein